MSDDRFRRLHPDRRQLQPWLLAAITVAVATCTATAGQAAFSRRGGDPTLALSIGAAAGALAVVGLRSLSVRLVARSLLAASAGVLVRFGALRGSLTGGGQDVLAWVVASVVVFVLTDRIGTDAQPALGDVAQGTGPSRPSASSRAEPVRTARAALVAALGVVLVAVVLTPLVLPRLSDAASTGEGPRLSPDQSGSVALRSTDSLDMTTRPELTDEVLFRVTADRPTFWRGETFDQWDGRRWTRSDGERFTMLDGTVTNSPFDLAAQGGERFTQRIRMEATFSEVIYGAPSIVSVQAPRPLAQRLDGTVTTEGTALGRGASYQVISRRPQLSEARLRAATGALPAEIQRRYTSDPVITERVRRAAQSVAEGERNTYDKVRALEAWMGARTEYSLDAPLSPRGVDVVDHFLFDSRQGWCEQVASSLAVMARANGIPARLVTGYVPDERDRVTGSYVVRARDAHAWTEVWFPELGWVPFDPTADVPLAATDGADASWSAWLLDHALVLALGAGLLVAIGWPLRKALARWRVRVGADRRRSRSWAADADHRLVALGERVGRPRAAGETASSYATALGLRYHEPGLAAVGRLIDDALFAPKSPDRDRTDPADAVLERLGAAEVPAAPPVELRTATPVD